MNLEEAEERLQNYLREGIATEIFWADQAFALTEEIGTYAEQINAANFGELFGSLQFALSDRHTLSIAKIFDPVKRYPTRSIPATLAFLESNAELWRIPGRRRLLQMLVEAGSDDSHIVHLNDAELTYALVAHYRNTLPDPKRDNRLSFSLDALRQTRDKVIVHNEAIDSSTLQGVTWGEATSLVNYAKEFVATVGDGYLNLFFGQGSEDYMLAHDARRASISIRRLLRVANITKDVRR